MHHVDVHVADLAKTRELLDALMPIVGYEMRRESDGFVAYWKDKRRPSIGFLQDTRPGSGMMRLAFSVASAEAVDAVAAVARAHAARFVEGPAIHDEYGDDYYAVFFEDADGNKFEVVVDATTCECA